ncbi:protein lin-52 homolog [Drosophila albomicans]|uniref:Protein lin-52 homolog n=1 Tax=Drosophila albomicans TaxID=7291 RepID=A0A6P8ZGC7_DROAB|nr:protein lin-52 homolog [Drosophila albomicans]
MSNSEAELELSSAETTPKTKKKTEEGSNKNNNNNAGDAAASETKNLTAKEEDDLTSTETLRESPVQWPERFPGMEEFLSLSETPIHTPSIDPAQLLTSTNKTALNKFARMPPDQLIDKIKAMHDEIYKLGILESKEMTRGKLLGIFDRDRLTKTKGN